MTYQIVKYGPEFRNQILGLQAHLWGKDLALNSRYMEWKYEVNPYLNVPMIYVAMNGDKVVGMRGYFGALWQIGQPGTKHVVLCAGDLVIDPQHRSRGLFRQLSNFAVADLSRLGHKLVFSLSVSPITFLGSLRMDWRNVGSYQTFRREKVENTTPWEIQRLVKTLRVVWRYASSRWFLSPRQRGIIFDHLDRWRTRKVSELSQHVTVEKAPRSEARSRFAV